MFPVSPASRGPAAGRRRRPGGTAGSAVSYAALAGSSALGPSPGWRGQGLSISHPSHQMARRARGCLPTWGMHTIRIEPLIRGRAKSPTPAKNSRSLLWSMGSSELWFNGGGTRSPKRRSLAEDHEMSRLLPARTKRGMALLGRLPFRSGQGKGGHGRDV